MATRFGTENEDRVREGFDHDTAAQVKELRKAGCKKIFEANVLRTRVFCRGCMAGTRSIDHTAVSPENFRFQRSEATTFQ
jgi:hypothetical protein